MITGYIPVKTGPSRSETGTSAPADEQCMDSNIRAKTETLDCEINLY